MAITLIEKSIKNEFDKCFILSADNDFASAITRAKQLNPNIKIIIQPPPLSRKKPAQKRDYAIDNLEYCSGNKALLTHLYTIRKHQFSDKCKISNPCKIGSGGKNGTEKRMTIYTATHTQEEAFNLSYFTKKVALTFAFILIVPSDIVVDRPDASTLSATEDNIFFAIYILGIL